MPNITLVMDYLNFYMGRQGLDPSIAASAMSLYASMTKWEQPERLKALGRALVALSGSTTILRLNWWQMMAYLLAPDENMVWG